MIDKFNEYLRLNYGFDAKQNCEGFIKELWQTRNLISFLSAGLGISSIDTAIRNSMTYLKTINQLDALTKLDSRNVNIIFSWTEVNNDKITKSSNLLYEICSVKYNIAVLLCNKGYINYKSKDENVLKEVSIWFKQAAGIFNEIQKTVNSENINLQVENIPDFNYSYIDSCLNYCLGMSQICIYKISIIKKMSDDFLSKLAYGAHKLLQNALNSNIPKVDRGVAKFISKVYYIISLYHKRKVTYEEFDKKGKGLGLVISYENLILELLKECEKMKEKYGNVDLNTLLNNIKSKVEFDISKHIESNTKIYKEKILEKDDIPEIESIIMAKIPDNLFENSHDAKALYSIENLRINLMSPDMKNLVDKYMESMKKYLDGVFNTLETPQKIEFFLSSHSLSQFALKEPISNMNKGIQICKISQNLFSKMEQVRQKGGLMCLLQKAKGVDARYNKLREILGKVETAYEEKKSENESMKIMYEEKWNVPFDQGYGNKINEINSFLLSQRKNDIAVTTSVMQDKEYYEILSIGQKQQIEQKIPKKSSQNTKESSPIQNELYVKCNELVKLEKNIRDIQVNLIAKVGEEIPIDGINQIKKGQTTMEVIIEQHKKSFDQGIGQIRNISKNVFDLYKTIDNLYNKYISENNIKEDEGFNEKYISFFNNVNNDFDTKVTKLDNSLKRYDILEEQIKKLNNEMSDHFQARELMIPELKEQLESEFRRKMAQNTVKKE